MNLLEASVLPIDDFNFFAHGMVAYLQMQFIIIKLDQLYSFLLLKIDYLLTRLQVKHGVCS